MYAVENRVGWAFWLLKQSFYPFDYGDRLAFASMTTREPAVGRQAAVLIQQLSLLMPPKVLRVHGRIIRLRSSFVLAREVEPPRALPILHGHVDRPQRVTHLVEPDFVCVSHSHSLYSRRR